MKILVSHPTGNANVRAAIEAFHEHGILSEFDTTIATNPNSKWIKMLPGGLRAELLRRTYPIESKCIKSYPLREVGRLGFQKIGFKQLTKHEIGKFSVHAVYTSMDQSVAGRILNMNAETRPDAVYAYEDGALATFEQAVKLNITRIYDLPKGYWRAERELLGKEMLSRPEWAVTLAGFKDSEEKLRRKDMEIRKANHIIVASSFTKSTLEYYPDKHASVSVVPYGFPPVRELRNYNYDGKRKLKLLFVGSLSQLKGLANVLEAVDALTEKVELTIVGRKSTEDCLPLNEGLKKHRYINSLPHHKVLEEMSIHDVFLFPSLFEGFGLVVTEAMSQGTPVITTRRTCGADIINHNENGWLVEAGSTEALTNQLKDIISNPELIEKNGRAAINVAKSRPWTQYGKELVETVKSLHSLEKNECQIEK